MSKTELIGNLVAECLARCRESGYTLTTMIRFLDELRRQAIPEADVQRVDAIMRQILGDILSPKELDPISESPTAIEGGNTVKMPRAHP